MNNLTEIVFQILCGLQVSLDKGNYHIVTEVIEKLQKMLPYVPVHPAYTQYIEKCFKIVHEEIPPEATVTVFLDDPDSDFTRLYTAIMDRAVTDGLLTGWCDKLLHKVEEQRQLTTIRDVLHKTEANQITFVEAQQQIASINPISFSSHYYLSAKEMAEHKDDTAWCVDKLIPAGTTSIISGESGNGKSLIVLDLALRYASPNENKWLDTFALTGGKVVFIDAENPPHVTGRRLELLRAEYDERLYFINANSLQIPRIDVMNPKCCERLLNVFDTLRLKDTDIVIFDSLRRTFSGEENSSTDIANYFDTISGLTPASKIVIHHLRKRTQAYSSPSQRLRGSGDIEGAVSVHLCLETHGTGTGKITKVKAGKVRDEDIKPFNIFWIDNYMNGLKFTVIDEGTMEKLRAQPVLAFLRQVKHRVSKYELATETGVGKEMIDSILDYLSGNNPHRVKFIQTRNDGNMAYYEVNNESAPVNS